MRLYSFPLRRQVVHETATGCLRNARETLDRVTGEKVGTRQLMQIAVDAAHDVRDFYQQQLTTPPPPPPPPPAAEVSPPGGTC